MLPRRCLMVSLLVCGLPAFVAGSQQVPEQKVPEDPGVRVQPQRQVPAPRPVDLPFEKIASPALSPDGAQVVFCALDPNDRWQIHTVPLEGGAPVTLTAGPHDNRSPRFSPDGTQIAFVSNRSGTPDIWAVAASGGAARQVTSDPSEDGDPEWSPDGGKIVFASDRGGATLIYVVAAAGGQVFPLSYGAGPHRRPVWSPDGEWIAFESRRDKEWHVWVLPAAGGEARRLGARSEEERAPSWSADSRRVRAVGSMGAKQIFLAEYPIDESSGEARTVVLPADSHSRAYPASLARGGDLLVFVQSGQTGLGLIDFRKGGGGHSVTETSGIMRDPSWSADGRKLVFASDRDGQRDLYVAGVSTGRTARLTDDVARESDPHWSRARGDIAYTLESDAASGIYITEPETGKSLRVVGSDGSPREPSWSPDGKQIAFASNKEGSPDIWVVPVIGEPTPRRVTSLPGAETHPTWSPDGQWIAFASDQGGRSEIWKISATGEATDPVRLSQSGDGDYLHPDWNARGNWIACTGLMDGKANVTLIPFAGGKPVPYYGALGDREIRPAWSPDSNFLAFEWSKPDRLMALSLPPD